MMIRFDNDYTEGAHERILQKIVETNKVQTPGYGMDEYSARARQHIQKACETNGDVHFLVGGTQTNTAIISSILRPYQGVLAATTGHIAVHETGAIESTGHKVLTLESDDGKITAAQVQAYVDTFYSDATYEHMVQPGLVYISHPTENGTTYTKEELAALSNVCQACDLPLMLDGARLGYGLIAQKDVTLADIARLCDVFYIGGTKVGALFGEAVVITNEALKKDFRSIMKQRGGLLAKGRLLGIQFETLFEDGLYEEIAQHAVGLAMDIRAAFLEKGIELRYDSMTNQQFPILANGVLEQLKGRYLFAYWERASETHSVVRFCTSWSTMAEDVAQLISDIKKLDV